MSALKIIDKSKIVLILLDVMMQKLDGINDCIRFREKTNASIIFIYAKTDDMDIENRLMSGGDDYITKQFSPIQLRTIAVKKFSRKHCKTDIAS